MNKSISATFSIFIALVLVFGVFSIHGNIYGQTATPNTTTSLLILLLQIMPQQQLQLLLLLLALQAEEEKKP